MRRRCLAVLICALTINASSISLADTTSPAANPSAKVKAEAARRVARGGEAYDQGRYEEALRLYLAAYDLIELPEILFNVGLAREKMLDFEGCVRSFRNFLLRTANDPNAAPSFRVRAEERAARCRQQAAVVLHVSSIPAGARVTVSSTKAADSFAGRTPVDLRLSPGSYVVHADVPGYAPGSQSVEVDVDAKTQLDFTLEKLSLLGIEADVAGAFVTVNGGHAEPAPVRREVQAGVYEVTVSKVGFRTVQRQARVGVGEQATLLVSLPPLPVQRKLSLQANTRATAFIDGKPVGTLPLDVTVDGGSHRLDVNAAGWRPFSDSLVVSSDRDLQFRVELARERSATQSTVIKGFVVASAVAAVTAAVFGVRALNEHADYKTSPSLSLADEGKRHALTADIFIGATLVSAAVALGLYLWTTPGESLGSLQ
jgi:hypothetical protein